jgi:hypothetical protein
VYETWSLIVKEEHKQKVFENTLLRRIFGPKRDEVLGGWTTLHNMELHNLNTSPNIMRIINSKRRWEWRVARMGKKRNAYRILVGKSKGNNY